MGLALYSEEAFFHLVRAGAAVKASSSAALLGTSCRCSPQRWPGMLSVTRRVPSILLPVTRSHEVLVRGRCVKLADGEQFSRRQHGGRSDGEQGGRWESFDQGRQMRILKYIPRPQKPHWKIHFELRAVRDGDRAWKSKAEQRKPRRGLLVSINKTNKTNK